MSISINRVAVLGAGIMGSGIAALLAGAGIEVYLLDIVPPSLSSEDVKNGLSEKDPLFRNSFSIRGKERIIKDNASGLYEKSQKDLIVVGNTTDNMDYISKCDWIIEVVLEDIEVKKKLMKDIEKVKSPRSIVSTNTSGVSVNKIVEDMPKEFREYFLGTHFFNPPRHMKLFEIIPVKDTKKEILDFFKSFAVRVLGKGVVEAKDTPNFIGNRIGTFSIINTMEYMKEYGYSIEEIDILTGPVIGRPKTGTFKTLDLVGIDIFKHVADNVVNNVDDHGEKSKFEVPYYVIELINQGKLGDKTREGFYKKVKSEKGISTFVWSISEKKYVEAKKASFEEVSLALKSDNKYKAMVYGDKKSNKFVWDIIKNILVYSASKISEISDDYTLIDNAMKWGFNWEKGPFEIWDAIGVEKSIEKMREEGIIIPQWIEKRIENGKIDFYDSKKDEVFKNSYKIMKKNEDIEFVELGDEIAGLFINSKGNSITEQVLDVMLEAIDKVENNYKGLIIGGKGKNFCAGANLQIIGKCAMEKRWDDLENLIIKLQDVNMKIKYSKRPVVSMLHGMTLGGGAEVAMHSHFNVIAAETYMGLTEVGVGLIPSGGGTKEYLIKAVESAVDTSKVSLLEPVKKAWQNIAMATVSTSGHDAVMKGFTTNNNYIVMNNELLFNESFKKIKEMSENSFRVKGKKDIVVLGDFGRSAIEFFISEMKMRNLISDHDKVIARKIAYVLTGGNVVVGTTVPEEYILELEREAFLSLCGEEKTIKRIEYMLSTGKPLRN